MATIAQQKPQIQIKRIYKHNIQAIWKALTSKEALSEWLMETSDFALIKGHQFQFKTKPQGNFDGIINCEIVDFQSPTSVSYQWRANNMKIPTTVHWELKELSPTETSITLSHAGFTGVSGWFTRQLLTMGWKKLLSKKLTSFLNTKTSTI